MYPRKLRRRFQTYDELEKLISSFAKTKYCSPISNKVLEEFATKTRSENVTFWNGSFKSRFCSLVAQKHNHCLACRNLKFNLMKAMKQQGTRSKPFNERMNSLKRKNRSLKKKAMVHFLFSYSFFS